MKTEAVIFNEPAEVPYDAETYTGTTVEAGLVSTLTSTFIKDYNSDMIDTFTDRMINGQVPEYCTQTDIGGVLTTHLCIGE